jgi:hypothetical protein
MKYSLIANDKVHDNTYNLYKKVFKKLKIEESKKDPWKDYDILIYLKRSPLYFGKYDQYHTFYFIKPEFDKIQNDKGGYIGRLPNSYYIKDKTFFNYNIFSFYPYSFNVYIKRNTKEIKNYLKHYDYWIIKPSQGTRGNNIVISKAENVLKYIDKYKKYLFPLSIQRYIENPLLLNGYKFDFRVYVLYIDNKLYINKYYYVRLAKKHYNYNNPTDIKAGLTNFSLHNDINFMWTKDKFLKEYERQYPKNSKNFLDNNLIKKFTDIIEKVFKFINGEVSSSFWKDPHNNYFNLFGFDFLPDEDGKIYLLEINPSIGLSDNRKNSQAEKVITDMIKIIIGKENNKNSFIRI